MLFFEAALAFSEHKCLTCTTRLSRRILQRWAVKGQDLILILFTTSVRASLCDRKLPLSSLFVSTEWWRTQWLPVQFGATGSIHAEAPGVLPSIDLGHQCRCQHSDKGRWYLSVIIKYFCHCRLPDGIWDYCDHFHPLASWVCRPHFENWCSVTCSLQMKTLSLREGRKLA